MLRQLWPSPVIPTEAGRFFSRTPFCSSKTCAACVAPARLWRGGTTARSPSHAHRPDALPLSYSPRHPACPDPRGELARASCERCEGSAFLFSSPRLSSRPKQAAFSPAPSLCAACGVEGPRQDPPVTPTDPTLSVERSSSLSPEWDGEEFSPGQSPGYTRPETM